MKKKLVAILLAGSMMLGLSGCGGETATNEYGQEINVFGPYIEIEHSENIVTARDYWVRTYTVYHRETKEMFEIWDGGQGGWAIRQIWDYDEEGHPVVKYYEGEGIQQ